MNNNIILNFFANIGKRYVENILSIIEIDKLKSDKSYANKMFFYYWAFERQGAPKGFRVAAIKTLETAKDNNYEKEFEKYYSGERNKRNNPILDKRISGLNISQIVSQIEQKNFKEAFNGLKLNGIGHKIRAFFIRDIVYLLRLEEKNKIKPSDYLFMSPLDVWVELTLESLNLKEYTYSNLKLTKYDLSRRKDLNILFNFIKTCLEFNISPLLTNMGIWYYASHFVADKVRLKELIKTNSVEELKNEMNLMKGFSEIKRQLIK